MQNPCGAKTRTGGTCANPPVSGAQRCRMHGGRTEKAKARAEAEMIARTLGEDLIDHDGDPAEMLLRLCRWKYAETLWLRSKVATIGEDGAGDGDLTYGLSKHEDGIGPQGVVDQKTYVTEPNIWWRLLREAEDQLARYSALALKSGIERRQIELQEAQALHLATAINRILDALELSSEQARLVPDVVPRILRELPIGEK